MDVVEPWDWGQVSTGLSDKGQGLYLYGGGTDDCRAGGGCAACFPTSRKDNRKETAPAKAKPIPDTGCFLSEKAWD